MAGTFTRYPALAPKHHLQGVLGSDLKPSRQMELERGGHGWRRGGLLTLQVQSDPAKPFLKTSLSRKIFGDGINFNKMRSLTCRL